MAILSAIINCDQGELFAVLTDYARYPEWTADVVAAEVLDREGDIVVAEFVSPELFEGRFVIEFVHSAPDSIVYRQVDQYGSRGLQGRWKLAPVSGKGVKLTGQMQLRSTVWAAVGNARRASLVLQRRLDLLERMFSGEASPRWELVYH